MSKEPIKVGDTVQWGVNRGELISMGPTHSVLRRAHQKDAKAPNSRLRLIWRREGKSYLAFRDGVNVGIASSPDEAVSLSFGRAT